MEAGGAADACVVVELGYAVARESTTAVLFAGCEHAGVDTLQKSKQSAHVRNEAPIAGIAWLHCLVERWVLRDELACVIYTHGQSRDKDAWTRRFAEEPLVHDTLPLSG